MNKPDKTPRPHYRPVSYRNLEKFLGESDSVIEWIEVAVRQLIDDCLTGGDNLLELARKHRVSVNPIDPEHISTGWARLQVLNVYQWVEWFLDEFKEEHPRIVRKRDKKEDLISYSVDAFGVKKTDIGMLEFGILDYYRLVRNHIVHTPKEPQPKVQLTQQKKLREELKDNDQYSSLSAPNTLKDLTFDDFILFSRVLKHFARVFCEKACPTNEEMLLMVKEDLDFLKVLRGTAQKPSRVQDKLQTYLSTRFGFSKEVGLIIAQKLIHLGLLAQ